MSEYAFFGNNCYYRVVTKTCRAGLEFGSLVVCTKNSKKENKSFQAQVISPGEKQGYADWFYKSDFEEALYEEGGYYEVAEDCVSFRAGEIVKCISKFRNERYIYAKRDSDVSENILYKYNIGKKVEDSWDTQDKIENIAIDYGMHASDAIRYNLMTGLPDSIKIPSGTLIQKDWPMNICKGDIVKVEKSECTFYAPKRRTIPGEFFQVCTNDGAHITCTSLATGKRAMLTTSYVKRIGPGHRELSSHFEAIDKLETQQKQENNIISQQVIGDEIITTTKRKGEKDELERIRKANRTSKLKKSRTRRIGTRHGQRAQRQIEGACEKPHSLAKAIARSGS